MFRSARGPVDASPETATLPLFSACFPNPARGVLTIVYSLPQPGPANLRIFDVRGFLVRSLAAGTASKGLHRVVWDGRDARGEPVATGTYFYRLQGSGRQTARRVVLIR